MSSITDILGLDPHLPVDGKSAASRSKQALGYAVELNLLNFMWPLDTKDESPVQATREMIARSKAPDVEVKTDGKQYYFALVRTSTDTHYPVLIGEGQVIPFIRAHHALTIGAEKGLFQYLHPVPTDSGQHQFKVIVNGTNLIVDMADVETFVYSMWGERLRAAYERLREQAQAAGVDVPPDQL